MADVSINGPRVKYSPEITLGNISIIISGLVVAASLLVSIVMYAGSLQDGISRLNLRLDWLECTLASKGELSTTTQCNFKDGAHR